MRIVWTETIGNGDKILIHYCEYQRKNNTMSQCCHWKTRFRWKIQKDTWCQNVKEDCDQDKNQKIMHCTIYKYFLR
jgi:hypothetical protein